MSGNTEGSGSDLMSPTKSRLSVAEVLSSLAKSTGKKEPLSKCGLTDSVRLSPHGDLQNPANRPSILTAIRASAGLRSALAPRAGSGTACPER